MESKSNEKKTDNPISPTFTDVIKSDINSEKIEKSKPSSNNSILSFFSSKSPSKEEDLETTRMLESMSNITPSSIDTGLNTDLSKTSEYILSNNKSSKKDTESSIFSGVKSSQKDESSSSTTAFSLFGFLANITWTTWLIIILLLAFFGFNLFIYLAKGTEDIKNTFAPFLKKILGFFGLAVGGTTKQIVEVSGEGTKDVVNASAGIATGAVSSIQQGAQYLPPKRNNNDIENNLKGANTRFTEDDYVDNSALGKAINGSQPQTQQTYGDYEADNSNSSIQNGNKSGWCFIGRGEGYRTCAQVTESDTCMSGQIFPTHDICVNPTLRV